MSVTRIIPIEKIHRRPDARPLEDSAVAALAESIQEVGLLCPVCVRLRPDKDYELIAGSHRLAACERLGHRDILCVEVSDDDLHAELAMIDENLVRAELSAADRAKQMARRKALYEELHPETRQHVAGGKARQEAASDKLSFAAATAQVTGRDQRTIQREASRGENITAEALELVRDTRLDTGLYLDKLKRLSPAEQLEAVTRDLAAPAPTQSRGATDSAPARSASVSRPQNSPESFERFVTLADELETFAVTDLIASSGRQRSVLGQRASGLADRMGEILEALQ